MKKIGLCLVGLMPVLSLAQVAVTRSNSSYDPMADVNRDGLVDVDDLNRIGHAYGSTGLVHEAGKTVISVWNETSPMGNVRIAIFDGWTPQKVGYTDSTGTVNFILNPTKNYTAVAWREANYNYANFTTNSWGEASVSVLLDNKSKHLPSNWVVVSVVNETSEAFVVPTTEIWGAKITHAEQNDPLFFRFISETPILVGNVGLGIYTRLSELGLNEPNSTWGFVLFDSVGNVDKFVIHTLDENNVANVVIYV
jgi:hypothetical protein